MLASFARDVCLAFRMNILRTEVETLTEGNTSSNSIHLVCKTVRHCYSHIAPEQHELRVRSAKTMLSLVRRCVSIAACSEAAMFCSVLSGCCLTRHQKSAQIQ